MDPETAKQLFEGGATVVFLDVPPNTEVGIDMNVWRTGERFKGLKMIPPGLHLLYYSSVGKEDAAAPRTSCFHVFKEREVYLRKWDNATETVVHHSDPETLNHIQMNKEDLDRYLGAFPYETWKKWFSLTSHISEELVKRLEPELGVLSSASELVPDKRQDVEEDADSEEAMLPKMHKKHGTELRFTKLPSKDCLEDTSPEFKTRYSLDSSLRLEMMFQLVSTPEDLLGELQFAFVSFLVGHVYDAFEHWKKLVQLFCTCDAALKKHPDFFLKFMLSLHYQIQEVPEDFFTDIMSKENFLVSTLHILFSNIEDEGVPPSLKQRGAMFKAHLTKKFKWDFSEEPDEFAPTVVGMM